MINKDKDYLLDFLSRHNNKKTVFTISTSVTLRGDVSYYLTPERINHNSSLVGVVLSDLNVLTPIKDILILFDCILVDQEKKLLSGNATPINLERFVWDMFGQHGDEFVNKIRYYKANDLTVDSAFEFLNYRARSTKTILGGKDVLILGAGNIGFKLGIKLVEAGVNVWLYRRDSIKLREMVNVINSLRPMATVAKAKVFELDQDQIYFAVVGASSSCIDIDISSFLGADSVVIDIGKGSFSLNMIQFLQDKNVDCVRLSVENELKFLVMKSLSDELSYPLRSVIDGIHYVSGGMMGKYGELVVNNASNPTIVYGVANGCGDFIDEE